MIKEMKYIQLLPEISSKYILNNASPLSRSLVNPLTEQHPHITVVTENDLDDEGN
jgi:hypothetical protein